MDPKVIVNIEGFKKGQSSITVRRDGIIGLSLEVSMSVCYPNQVEVLPFGLIQQKSIEWYVFPKVECDQVLNMGQQVNYGKAKLEVSRYENKSMTKDVKFEEL